MSDTAALRKILAKRLAALHRLRETFARIGAPVEAVERDIRDVTARLSAEAA